MTETQYDETFPDIGSMSDQELKDLIGQLTEEERQVSYRRRVLHGKIDILRAELVNRLRKKHEGGQEVITGDDVLLYVGLALALVATVEYGRSAAAQLRAGRAAPSSST